MQKTGKNLNLNLRLKIQVVTDELKEAIEREKCTFSEKKIISHLSSMIRKENHKADDNFFLFQRNIFELLNPETLLSFRANPNLYYRLTLTSK